MEKFIKKNSSPFKNQLFCEALGLKELGKRAGAVGVPKVFKVNQEEIILEKIHAKPFNVEGQKKLGQGLARIHQDYGDYFGYEEDNYIGLNPQINSPSPNWGTFFLRQRLGIQVEFMQDQELQSQFREILERKAQAIVEFLNDSSPRPSPLHGDLWSGNALYDEEKAWLIDPAFYFGHREADLAMTEMFGGFSNDFYESYDEELPRSEGYERRKTVYNLYHYLNHFNLFGSSYLFQVKKGFNFLQQI